MIRNTLRFCSLLALTAVIACAGTVSQAYTSDTLVDSIEGFVWPASGPADPSVMFEMPSFPAGWTAQLVNPEHFSASGPMEQVNPFTITVSTPVLAYVDLFAFNGGNLNEWARVSTGNLAAPIDWYTVGNAGSTQSVGFAQSIYSADLARANAAAVPEPATMGLMGASLLGLGAFGFRRRQR